MADDARNNANWLVIFTAALSLVSALGVGYLSYRTKNIENDVKREEIAFEQAKFESEQLNRNSENLKVIIPKLVSKDEQDVKVGMSILFTLFPSNAKNILESVNSALTEQQQADVKDKLQPALQRAERLQAQSAWIIIMGADQSIQDGDTEMKRARAAGYSPTLYLKQGMYRTTIGTFPTQGDAERANIDVRATLRSGAYVVNKNSWCAKPSPKNDYIECLD